MNTMTIQQAATELGLSVEAVCQLAWNGELVANGDGLLSTESVAAYRHRQTISNRLNHLYKL